MLILKYHNERVLYDVGDIRPVWREQCIQKGAFLNLFLYLDISNVAGISDDNA